MKTNRLLVLILLFIFVLTGCWNSRELSDLAIVSAIGVDKAKEKSEYKISFQIVNPTENATGIAGAGGNAAAVFTVSETGTTIFEAIRKVSKKLSRQLFFAHIRLIVINESLAKEKGIIELFDLFERSREARMTSEVLIARGTKAESIISMITPLEKVSGYATAKKLEVTEKVWSENIKVEIDDVINGLVSEGAEPVISGVRIIGNPKEGSKTSNTERTKLPALIEISGVAIFKSGKLQKWLDGGDARGFMWVKNKMNSTIVRLKCKKKDGGVAIEVTGSKTKLKSKVHKEKIAVQIDIEEEGNVAEMNCAADLSKPEEIQKLEEGWVKETKQEIEAVIKIAQKEKIDIFGFGELINRDNPKVWNKMKKDWNEVFSELDVHVNVEAYIRRPGMRLQPYIKEAQKAGK